MSIRLFRGIAVSKNDSQKTIDEISTNGLLTPNSNAFWQASHEFVKEIDVLHLRPNLPLSDTRNKSESIEAVYACGDMESAYQYANFKNKTLRKNRPIIIEFEARLSSVIIDGKDFLCPIFQRGDPHRSRPILKDLFGTAILKYADLAWNSISKDYRVGQYDLAVNDRDAVRSHLMNKTILGGRHKTKFKSAFTISLPIYPQDIIPVQFIKNLHNDLEPKIHFNDLVVGW